MSDAAQTPRAGPLLWICVSVVVAGLVALAALHGEGTTAVPPDQAGPELAGIAPPRAPSGILGVSPGRLIDVPAVERSGRELRSAALKGDFVGVAFLFTRCGNTCPRLAGELKKLSDATANDPLFQVVAFTVQPEVDTPEVLSTFADRYHADSDRWLFLRTSSEDVQALARAMAVNNSPTNPILHANSLTILDPAGRVVAKYEPLDDADWVKRAVTDLATMREARLVEESER